MEWGDDGRFGEASAVMQVLSATVVVRKAQSCKVKLSIYRSVYAVTLTCGPELWAVTEGTHAPEMRFLRRGG